MFSVQARPNVISVNNLWTSTVQLTLVRTGLEIVDLLIILSFIQVYILSLGEPESGPVTVSAC